MTDDQLAFACSEAEAWVNESFARAKAEAQAWDLPKGTDMTEYLTLRVGELLAGDIWMQAGDEVRITASPESYVDDSVGDMVRISGRIIKGWGAGTKKVRTWTFRPTQTLEVKR